MNSSHNILMVGMVDAGKTSYMHALDEILQNPTTVDSLRAPRLADDRTNLERYKAKYRSGESIGRTERTPAGEPNHLFFEDPISKKTGCLYFPDPSGEIFRDQWANRLWDQAFGEQLPKLDGIMVFVRADHPSSNEELLGELINARPTGEKPQQWDPKNGSCQVQIVDVLQLMVAHGNLRRPLRVAVMLSAWDTIKSMPLKYALDPELYLKDHWALLHQYLASNPDQFKAHIYGVSALGGTDEERKTPEFRAISPEERVSMVDEMAQSKDITRPLRWLLQLA